MATASEHARKVSSLVQEFARQIVNYRLPEPVTEHCFATVVKRRHRFDFCWPDFMTAVECDGFKVESVYVRAGHVQRVITTGHGTPVQLQDDAFKRNMAAMLGWTVLVFHQNAIDRGDAIAMTQRVLVAKGWKPRHAVPSVLADQPF